MDINGDGRGDILSGSYSRMEKAMAGLFQVLHGKPDGSFGSAEVLKGTDDEPLIIPADEQNIVECICTRPFAVDWDGDGDLDLVVGNFAGGLYLFRGEGKGRFKPKPEPILAGDEPLHVNGHHGDPFAIDWDGDGDLDLLSGSASGGVQWAENVAGKGKPPELRSFQTLIEPGRSVAYGNLLREEELTGPTTSTRIWVHDVNGDGKLDVLVGDSVTLVTPAENLSEEEFKGKLAAWQAEVAAATKKLSSKEPDDPERAEVVSEYSKLMRRRSEFMNEDDTGFVWLYVRK